MVEDFVPERDASLGLVYRLNILWSKADYAALRGSYEEWNNVLDAIFRNLLYREDMVVEVDEKNGGVVTNVKLSKKDTKDYKPLSLEIAEAKKDYRFARSKRDKARARSVWYHCLQKKDVWLRKFMMKLKLYLKETEKRPGTSLFQDFGRGKR